MTFNAIKLFFIFLLFFIFTTPLRADFQFSNNLKLGDISPDVLLLQKILNSSPDTQVALTGPGSPGNETSFFGPLTRQAVIKFQEKYKNDILYPNNLISGTGIVGYYTKTKLNILIQNPPASSTQTPPSIKSLSSIQVTPGSSLTIIGSGFTDELSVYIGSQMIQDPKITSSTNIVVTVPSEKGVQLVWVSNVLGDTRADYPMFVLVADPSGQIDNLPQILQIIEAQNKIISTKD